jgi:hypothetical protein
VSEGVGVTVTVGVWEGVVVIVGVVVTVGVFVTVRVLVTVDVNWGVKVEVGLDPEEVGALLPQPVVPAKITVRPKKQKKPKDRNNFFTNPPEEN